MAPQQSQSHGAEFADESGRVCVMDASGEVGAALVDRLLQLGYAVHAAVRSLAHPGELKSNNKRLQVFQVDPFNYQTILDAFKGCTALFYSFEPPLDCPSYDERMPEVEARSAQNVLEACAQTDTMLKVIFTSSVTAVLWRDDLSSNHLNERHWSNVDFCNKFKLWHALSKTVAEKAAWALAMDRDVVNMVSINAGFILGASGLALSNPFLKRIAEMYRNGLLVTVHLDFLVDAHICVFQDVSSYGRYICFDHVVNRHQDALQLAAMLPPPSAPPAGLEDSRVMYPQRISNKKLNKLMINFEMSQLSQLGN